MAGAGRKTGPQTSAAKRPRTKTTKTRDGLVVTSAAAHGGVRKPHRFRPGTVALREIRHYQKSTDLLMKKAPFRRAVRHHGDMYKDNLRWAESSLMALQIAFESFMVDVFADAHLTCLEFGYKTLLPAGLKAQLRGMGLSEMWNGNDHALVPLEEGQDEEDLDATAAQDQADLEDDDDDDDEEAED